MAAVICHFQFAFIIFFLEVYLIIFLGGAYFRKNMDFAIYLVPFNFGRYPIKIFGAIDRF